MTGFHTKLILTGLAFWLLLNANAQSQFFKFKISKEGVYHLSQDQARLIGASSISEVSVFGYQGMLPQLVDSSFLELQEIPALEKDGKLYFYLSSPHTYSYSESEGLNYNHHLFSDSLSFLISKTPSPRRIESIQGEIADESPAIFYEWSFLKEEENNILNSGRVWYSRSLAPGVTRGYAFPLQSDFDSTWKLSAILMSQSLSTSSLKLAVDDLIVSSADFAPIPSSTYGVKGRENSITEDFIPAGNKIDRVRITFESSDVNASGYFEYLGFGAPVASIGMKEGVFSKSSKEKRTIQPAQELSVWEISDFHNPIQLDFSSGNKFEAQKIVVFNPNEPLSIQELSPANLSLRNQESWPELLIISPKIFSNSAEKLRVHKLARGIFAEVVYLDEVYDSFGYGNNDLNAVRNLISWHFHKGKNLKNVLILGKGTFDYKGKLGGRPNLVPIYTSQNSLNPLATFSSDDYFGLIGWGQGIWEESRAGDEIMQIGVGRLPVITTQEAAIVVNKIIKYEENPAPGDWKRTVTFLADDGDNNIHLRDSEAHASTISEIAPELKQNKLYLDRFPQISNEERQSSPETKKALEMQLQEGTLFLNYVGHGNETTLTAEEIFLVSDIQNWANQEKLALWVTATCEFGRHDSPFIRSAAEELLTVANKGAIGLLTTGRPVFSSVNFSLNEAFMATVFEKENGIYQDLGSIFKTTKNQSLNGPLNRNFSLLGDPSMRLAAPNFTIEFTSFKNPDSGKELDTLSIYQVLEFEAQVINPSSKSIEANFEGDYKIELRDKPESVNTLGDESAPTTFKEESVLLFQGAGLISSGKMKGELIIPKNSNPEFGKGRFRIIGKERMSLLEAYGESSPILGGELSQKPLDQQGPIISPIFGEKNDPKLTFASTTIPLFVSYSDESGINISNLKPSELLQVQVNDNPPQPINNLFLAEAGSFKNGTVNLMLPGFKEGENKVTFLAWDNLGNASVLEKEIRITGSERLQITRHLTFPNPTVTESNFIIEHNRPGENLLLTLSVYNLNGQILFTKSDRLVKADALINGLTWIFSQSQTKYPAKGTYIYMLTLQSEIENSSDMVSGKIVIQ
ncbi:MAG: type IX secretion system sortase PorU [Algoriphagus sp.]|uniref:type IX secretion system sortase PorU n=1 Tax=Algoriphagus sp. TaxID=1872435 RepID=UPI002639FDF1|nr:type IX secretion system sortase PorU [Algoriphagus sp.]MDG1276497.1 type IX secretion system sortase PorU [Algoriphagus sp.]